MKELSISIVPSPEDAPDYKGTASRSAELTRAIIVKGGTTSGKPTVDLQFVSEDGTAFVAMTTGAILEGLAAAIQGAKR